MPLILPGNVASATAAVGFDVDNSCRFNDGDSPSFSKTRGTPTSEKKYTCSAWIKFCTFGTNVAIAGWWKNSSQYLEFTKDDDDRLKLYIYETAAQWSSTSIEVLRDPSAWYHLMFNVDSTDDTAGDRVKIYINGVRTTTFESNTSNVSLNSNVTAGLDDSGTTVSVGASGVSAAGNQYFLDGYMAEFVHIDGTDYVASDFGEFDEDSPTIWKPKEDVADLTFGNEGFYLDFEDSDNLGDDEGSNTDDLAENNIVAADQATDTPTNSFCTLNPLDWSVTGTAIGSVLSEGNCLFTSSGAGAGNNSGVGSTMGVTKGKWYWESKTTSTTTGWLGMVYKNIGGNSDSNGGISSEANNMFYGISTGGEKSLSGSQTSDVFTALSANDIMSFAYDLDNGYFYFGVNGTYVTSGDPTSAGSGTGAIGAITAAHIADGMRPAISNGNYGASSVLQMNFGGCPTFTGTDQDDADGYGSFEYDPPSGYYALCTKNLGAYGG